MNGAIGDKRPGFSARFHDAMDAAQHIVKLGPCAVELVDRTMLDLALSNAAFAPIVREVVQAHGGHVEATSDPVYGTTFTVRLPLHGLSERSPVPFPIKRVA